MEFCLSSVSAKGKDKFGETEFLRRVSKRIGVGATLILARDNCDVSSILMISLFSIVYS